MGRGSRAAAKHLKATGKVDPSRQERSIGLTPRPSSALQTCPFRLRMRGHKAYRRQELSSPPNAGPRYSGSASVCPSSTNKFPPGPLPELTEAQLQSRNITSLSKGLQTQPQTSPETSPLPPSPSHEPPQSPSNAPSVDGETPHHTIQNGKALPCCGPTVPRTSRDLYAQLVVTEDTLQT